MCSTMVPNAVPLIRASEIRTMSFTPCARQLLRDRQVAGLRHARRAFRPGIAQHQHVVRRRHRDRDRRCARHVLDAVEHDRAALVLQQLRRCGGMLDDRAARREIAAQHRERAFAARIGLSRGRIASWPGTCSAFGDDLAAASPPVTVLRVEVEQRRRARARSCGTPPASMEMLHVVIAGRLQVDQHRHVAADRVERVEVDAVAPSRPAIAAR